MKSQTNHAIIGQHIARKLRSGMTDAEIRLWQRLRGRHLAGCKFRRQHPLLDYVVDFVCLERRLIVEVDGGQHMASEGDRVRDERLREAGFQVLRFWNNQVLQETDAVTTAIWTALQTASLNPIPLPASPLKGEEKTSTESPL